MPYDPRAFPTVTPKKAPPAPTRATSALAGADEQIRNRKADAIVDARSRRIRLLMGGMGLVVVAVLAAVWWETRPPDRIDWLERQINVAEVGRWATAMQELAKMKSEGKFPGMPAGLSGFAAEQREHPEAALAACRKAKVDPSEFLGTCDALGAAMAVEEQDRKADEHPAHAFTPVEGPTSELPEALRLEVEFGKKGIETAPPRLSEHLNPRDKANYALYLDKREMVRQAFDAAR